MRMHWVMVAVVVGCACLGCGVDLTPQGGGRAPLGGQVVTGGIEELAQPAVTADPAATGPATTQPAVETTLVPAEAGVGKQGQGYGGGVYTEPIRQRFRAEQRLIFDQITHAIELHKGLYGQAPQTQEEFMDKIIHENAIRLPELPAGQRYVYDPATAELLVEIPK